LHLLCLPPEKTINRSWLRTSIPREEMDVFKSGLSRLFDRLRTDEGEEHLKNIVADFLKDVWYRDVAEINTKGDVDLVVHKGKSSREPVAVIIETKRPGNVAEMVTPEHPNVKALHELILYYLRERSGGNIHLTRLIVSNIYTWYIFDAADLERHIYGNKELMGKFRDWEGKRLISSRTDAFYKEIVHPFLEGLEVPLPCAVVDLRSYEALSRNPASGDDEKLTALYRLFSPAHLLKLPFANDSNTLNREFYNELLHILGLEEIKEGGRKLIGRKPPARRDVGSLLENTINVLRVRGHGGDANQGGHVNHGGGKATPFPLPPAEPPGEEEADMAAAKVFAAEDRLFSIALELCITWINRVLFLKLLEGRLMAWHESAGGAHAFLQPPCLRDFDELEELFFEILAVRPGERSPSVNEKYGAVPYLNSSLFEATDLERQTIRVADLKDRLELPLYSATVLKDEEGRRSAGALPTLTYLLRFLDAFDFSGEGTGGVRETPRTIINAAVLGLIFEKINGYREGSFFTPGFITMYICREAIRRAVVEKFRTSGLPGMKKIKTCADLKERLNPTDPEARRQANGVIDSLTVCDPAVGSGHFLVSALNEIIALKGELGILSYPDGTRIKEYAVAVENDELVVTDNDDDRPFAYRLNKNGRPVPALQRLQEALFHEKQRLIEGCLFGVDINPKSVSICRLRLWIELLKHAYYTAESDYGQLETLPNIDINIKCGNSLISRFALAGGDQILPGDRGRLKALTDRYRKMVFHYKLSPANKGLLRREIDQLKEDLQGFSIPTDPDMKMLRKLDFDLSQTIFEFDRAGAERREQLQVRAEELRRLIAEKQRTIYRAAFEWRYEFPEILDKNGNFSGFDVVIGNPPYIRQELLGGEFKGYARSRYEVYHGVADLYAYFFELGLAILGAGGCFSIIVANKWMRAGYGAPLRKWLKGQGLELIVDFGDLPVFTEATTYPCIVTIRKAASRESFRACTVSTLEALDLVELTKTGTVEVQFSSLGDSGWTLVGGAGQGLLAKLRGIGKSLGEYVDGKIYYGIKTGLNAAFVIDAATRDRLVAVDPRSAEVIKPFLLGRDIKRYQPLAAGQYLIFTRRGIDIAAYPAIEKYLRQFKERLMPKPKDWRAADWPGRKPGAYEWYEIQDTVDYWQEFEKPKLFWPEIAGSARFTYDEIGCYANNKTYLIADTSLYLLGLLNSSLLRYFIHNVCTDLQGDSFNFSAAFLKKAPIRTIDPDNPADQARHDEIVTLVEKTLRLHRELKELLEKEEATSGKHEQYQADISTIDRRIDALVYELYGLTEEEIRIVEAD